MKGQEWCQCLSHGWGLGLDRHRGYVEMNGTTHNYRLRAILWFASRIADVCILCVRDQYLERQTFADIAIEDSVDYL